MGHDESPEKLSLKARLKLFEKEIEQQGNTAPLPRTGQSVQNQTRYKDQKGFLGRCHEICVCVYVDSNPIFNVILFFISNADKKFSFLNADELAKMKEEEGKNRY